MQQTMQTGSNLILYMITCLQPASMLQAKKVQVANNWFTAQAAQSYEKKQMRYTLNTFA